MLRTRDFILLFTTVVFLVMAIGVTWFTQSPPSEQTIPSAPEAPADVSGVVTAVSETTMTRAERLAALRAKIADSELVIAAPVDNSPAVVPENGLATSSVTLSTPITCAGYITPAEPGWPATAIEVIEAEGVRQYFTTETVTVTQGTTTSEVIRRDVLLALPLRTTPLSQPSCIPTDIIGVALDGSLIRNSESGLYAIFSSETLIGYALDGFPLYGTGSAPVDQCGGRQVANQYRYELSPTRSVILNCFASQPQPLL